MRLLVADGHGLTRAGIQHALAGEEGLEVVGETESGPKLLPRIAQTQPDLVLLDLNLPGIDAQTSLTRIRDQHAGVQVIGLASQPNVEQMHNACSYGASGVILKTIAPGDLAGAIRQIIDGTTFTALGGSPFVSDPADGAGLTGREQEILEALARGLSNKQIAKDLFVTEQTVKFHLTNIYRKLNLTNRTAAARWAYAHGLATETYASA
jgi:two-component system, NarL family, response regulator DegU